MRVSFGTVLNHVRTRLRWRSDAAVTRTLRRRADQARDSHSYRLAAALYEEALRYAVGNPFLHKQCGHMFKEAGEYGSAEAHYLEAGRINPLDADLALQLGHFYKVTGRVDEAVACYGRALALKPDDPDAAAELARLGDGQWTGDAAVQPAWIVPELVPDEAEPLISSSERIEIRRLGAARVRTAHGYARILRGVEAVRGFCVSLTPLVELILLVDDREATRVPLTAAACGMAGKYVFNLWHDFSAYPAGPHRIELAFMGEKGRVRRHRATIEIAPPLREADAPDSDAIVDTDPAGPSIEAQLAMRPSMARSAARRPMQPPRTILVQRVDQLGDLACSVSAIRRLRAHFPDARIVALVSAANVDLARSLDAVDECVLADIVIDTRGRRTMRPEAQTRLRRRLEAEAFDLAIDLGEGADTRPFLLLSGARLLYGFRHHETPWLSAGFDVTARDPVNGLEILSPARKLVAMIDTLAALIAVGPSPAARLQPAPASGPPFICLHDGARLGYSRWPHFTALIDLILDETDLDIVFMSDGAHAQWANRASPRVTMRRGIMPFDDFDALLSSASVFVGNDSGPKHLAALRETPVVSLHMARLNWNEWGQEASGTIISRRVPCAGCAIDRAAEECGKDFACLHDIAPDEVFDAVRGLLPTAAG